MLSKIKTKLIQALASKKGREQHGLFLAEGTKTVLDLMPAFSCEFLAATPQWLSTHLPDTGTNIEEASLDELRKASLLKSPPPVIALFQLPEERALPTPTRDELFLALDGIQDPGNLGTIIRTADWFGVHTILCSEDCADAFNPKTVQSTMGALARVRLFYTDLAHYLSLHYKDTPIYGTLLEGANIYEESLSKGGILVMGNEGKGISAQVLESITSRLLIPNYPQGSLTSESLNVATATAVTLAEFRRRIR